MNTDQILSVVVFFLDLLVQTVHDTTLEDVWIIRGFHVAAVRVESRGMLSKKLNMFLCVSTSLVDGLATFSSPLCEFLALILDLSVETVEDG